MLHSPFHELETVLTALIELLGDVMVFLRTREPQREVFELPLHLPDTETVGERRIDSKRVLSELSAQNGRIGNHVAQRLQAACEFEKHHTQVITHGNEHFAHHLTLRVGGIFSRHLGEFVNTVKFLYQTVDRSTKTLFNPFARVLNDARHHKQISCCLQFRIVSHLAQNSDHGLCVIECLLSGFKLHTLIKGFNQTSCQTDI